MKPLQAPGFLILACMLIKCHVASALMVCIGVRKWRNMAMGSTLGCLWSYRLFLVNEDGWPDNGKGESDSPGQNNKEAKGPHTYSVFFFSCHFQAFNIFFFFLPLLSYQNMLSEENMIIVMYNLYEFMHFISMELQTHWLLAWEMMLRALRLTCYVHCGQHSIRDMTLPCHTVY